MSRPSVFFYSLSIPHFSVTSISRLFLCSPHGSAADLQLKLVEILTARGLGRRRAGDRRPALQLHRWTREASWRAAPGGTATAATTATAKSSRLALTSRVQTTIIQPWLLAAGRAAATKHVCRALPNLVSVGWQRVGRGGGREPGCLARGASHCLHCSDQGRGAATPRRCCCCWAGKVRTVTWAQPPH